MEIAIVIGVLVVAAIAYFIIKKKDDDNEDSTPAPTPEIDEIAGHRTGFLLVDAGGGTHERAMNYLGLAGDTRNNIRAMFKKNGWNSMYVYTSNQGDGPPVNPYNEQFGSNWGKTLNMTKINQWKSLLTQARNEGLRPIIWFFADDSPFVKQISLDRKLKYIQDMLNHFDDVAAGYVIALEADEYMPGDQYQAIVKYLKANTKKKIGTHLIPVDKSKESPSYMAGVDYYFMQAGFADHLGHSEDKHLNYVVSKVKEKQKKYPAKGIITAEHSYRSTSGWAKKQANAAIQAGAKGSGTG